MATGISAYSKTAADNDDASSEINMAEGMSPGAVNNGIRQVMADLAKMRDDRGGALTLAGGTTAYTLASNGSVALVAGALIRAVVNAANTAASTLAVDSLGAKKIRKVAFTGSTPNDVALDVNDLVIDQHATFAYDPSADAAAGAWILLNPMGLATRVVTIASGSIAAAATQAITDIPATYRQLQLVVLGASSDTNTRVMQVRISVDNGSNYLATNYGGFTYDGVTPSAGLTTVLAQPAATSGTGGTVDLNMFITNYQGGLYPFCSFTGRYNSGGGGTYFGNCSYFGGTSAVNAIQLLWNGSGSFDAGTYILYGIR